MDKNIPLTVETSRLVLKLADPADASALARMMHESLESFRPWLHFAHKPSTVEDLELVERQLQTMCANREAFVWRVFTKGEQQLIGSVDLHTWDWEVPRCELGYWMSVHFTGQGYMTEAASAILDVAFKQLEVNRVEALCDSRNQAAIRLAERLGMQREGILRSYELDVDGKLCDQTLLALLASEWKMLI